MLQDCCQGFATEQKRLKAKIDMNNCIAILKSERELYEESIESHNKSLEMAKG